MRKLSKEKSDHIKGRLRMMGENTVTLAAKLGRPWSTVANTINGYRANPEVQAEIAAFLGETPEQLFGESTAA